MHNFINPFDLDLNEIKRQVNKALRDAFNGKIKTSFLIKIKEQILQRKEIYGYFDIPLSFENLFGNRIINSGKIDYEYEICNYIVGVHRSNCLLLTECDRAKKEQSIEYQQELIETVVKHIKLRSFAGAYLGHSSVLKNEYFIYFPLPYDIYALCVSGLVILEKNWKKMHPLQELLHNICMQALSALTMLDNSFLNSAYPICRGILELYLKSLVVFEQEDMQNLLKTFERFSKYAIEYSYKEEFSDDFDLIFEHRINKKQKDKLNFLHFGWVDVIDDYHKIIKYNPYKFNSLIRYLLKKRPQYEAFLVSVEKLYKTCHEYVHANIASKRYSIVQYGDISAMLYLVMEHIYIIICDIYKVDLTINSVDILHKAKQDFDKMKEQFENISKEKIKIYYKNWKV